MASNDQEGRLPQREEAVSIWCSTRVVRCLDYGHSGVCMWENKISESSSAVDFVYGGSPRLADLFRAATSGDNYVADYVYDPRAKGNALMSYLRMSVSTSETAPARHKKP